MIDVNITQFEPKRVIFKNKFEDRYSAKKWVHSMFDCIADGCEISDHYNIMFLMMDGLPVASAVLGGSDDR